MNGCGLTEVQLRYSWGTAAHISWGTAAHISWGTAPHISWGTAPHISWGTAPHISWGTAAHISWGTAAHISWGTAPHIPHLNLHERLYFRENRLLVCPLERTLRVLHNRSACFGCEKAVLSQAVGLDTVSSRSYRKSTPDSSDVHLDRSLHSNYLPNALFCSAVFRCLSPIFKSFPSLMSCSWRFAITIG